MLALSPWPPRSSWKACTPTVGPCDDRKEKLGTMPAVRASL